MTPERWRLVGQLCLGAAELSEEERARFLDAQSGQDRELRREVERLLAAERGAGSFLEGRAIDELAQELATEGDATLVGETFGPYRLLSLIGAGGMGEVYRGRDTRLGREVAVKVLPRAFSRDPDRLRRFEQEARAAGLLNHPNILVLHDFGVHAGLPYIVSELLEGTTLRACLEQGALSVRQAVDAALQIARGLAAAHEKGIVHRDLKPENLFWTKDGRIKLLDFGVAKLQKPELVPTDSAAPETAFGAILGTLGYLSPEQARGQDADSRSDIFAFGAVLYELLTGRRAFRAGSPAETLQAILSQEPEEPDPSLPPALRTLLRQCLEKRAEARFQSAHDLALSLEAFASSGSEGALSNSLPARARRRARLWPGLGVVTLVGAAGLAFWSPQLRHPREAPRVLRFSIPAPEQTEFVTGFTFHTMAVSPDGRQLALVASSQGTTALWVRSFASSTASRLPGTNGAMSPFWSADSRQIGFFADGQLKRTSATGGVPSTLCEAGRSAGSGSWNRDGTILFTSSVRRSDNVAIYRVSAAGGEPQPVTTRPPIQNEGLHLWPYFLPDGQHFLYLACNTPSSVEIKVQSLDSGESRSLLRAESRVAFALGSLLYVRDGVLLARPFDDRALRFKAEPVPLVERVNYFASVGNASFSVSDQGVLVYGAGEDVSRLSWFSRDGAELAGVGGPADYRALRLAPDTRHALLTIADPRLGTTDLWLHDLARDTATRITDDPREESFPIWSPDGASLIFSADRAAPPFLHRKLLSEGGEGQPLLASSGALQRPCDWSPDGKSVLYAQLDQTSDWDLWLSTLEGGGKPVPWLRTRFKESDARFSPDGSWVAYVSDESGRSEVYLRPFQHEAEKQRISRLGGSLPRWRRDGKELFYLTPDNTLTGVSIGLGPNLELGPPQPLFRIHPPQFPEYDVAADGQRFLVETTLKQASSAPFSVVVNWADDLKTE